MDANREDEVEPLSVGEVAELAKLFHEHHARLLAMLQRRLDPRLAVQSDAEGLLAEAFLVARRKWRKFSRSEMSPYVWLYGIARDCLIEAWRRENRAGRKLEHKIHWPERSSAQMAMGLIGSLASPSEILAREELQARVRLALDALRPADREIIGMRHFDELPFRDVASVLGISPDAAMHRYSRALRRLKDLCGDMFDHGEPES